MKTSPRQQLALPALDATDSLHRRENGRANQLDPQDRPFHDWYRFVLSFPPHLVRRYIQDFDLGEQNVILDPFCGTGTTLVESKLNGIRSIGIEANPFAHFASSVKVHWDIDPDSLTTRARQIADSALHLLSAQGIDDRTPFKGNIKEIPLKRLEPKIEKLLLADSISPLPLHKTLVLLDALKEHSGEDYYHHMLLTLANALVFSISNLHFGPEVGVGQPKQDTPVIGAWLGEIDRMASDLRLVAGKDCGVSEVHLADSRQVSSILLPNSIDAIITSPPYPNEKEYTRTTRLESVLLGFITSKEELRGLKRNLIRSNTRGVYKVDDDDQWVSTHAEIQRIAQAIEKRRMELGKTSGFERLYGRVTKLYFGGMARHLAGLRDALRPGARLAYVVGDQASYLRVMIRTGELLADIAQSLGYDLVRTDLFRTRFATATKEELREEVVILQWNGPRG